MSARLCVPAMLGRSLRPAQRPIWRGAAAFPQTAPPTYAAGSGQRQRIPELLCLGMAEQALGSDALFVCDEVARRL